MPGSARPNTERLDARGLDIQTDAIELNGELVTASAVELNILDGATLDVNELNILDGVSKTAAEINLLAAGVAGSYVIARSAAPVSLDGSNPTSFAHGLGTCLAVFVQLVGSGAPGVGTSVLTTVINGSNVDVYAWKPTSNSDPTLIASTGTETFNWFAIGTA